VSTLLRPARDFKEVLSMDLVVAIRITCTDVLPALRRRLNESNGGLGIYAFRHPSPAHVRKVRATTFEDKAPPLEQSETGLIQLPERRLRRIITEVGRSESSFEKLINAEGCALS
jgi:hypothetical protein